MVSPGELRVLSELTDEEHDAFEPSVGEKGEITYPPVQQYLDERDGETVDFLETMTDRGVLASEFEYKVYCCPNCSLKGMQYSTGCPNCESIHATREPAAVHPNCGTTLGHGSSKTAERADDGDQDQGQDQDQNRAEPNEELYCPDCDEAVSVAELETDRRYRCHECTEWFDAPTHRLWCRDCQQVSPPAASREESVYRYPVTAFGNRWIAEQVERRQLLAETFEARGYETSVDTTVPTSGGDELPVHVYAVDDLFDYRIVAGVHQSPTVDDVQRLVEAAREVDAQPVLLLTDGSVNDRVDELVETEDITIVSASDGTLSSEFERSDRARTSNPVFEWLDSLFPSSSTAKR